MSDRNVPPPDDSTHASATGCTTPSRRTFLGAVAAGAAGLAVPGADRSPAARAKRSTLRMPEPVTPAPGAKLEIGACKSIKMTCISEVGWLSHDRLNADVKAGGGFDANQWEVPWSEANAGGSCSLMEVEGLDGSRRKVLIDVGWNQDYMRRRFAQTGVDRQLASGDIEALFLTHEHVDHLFALQAVLELRPDLPIYIPATFRPEAYDFMRGARFPAAGARNAIAHAGPLIRLKAGGVNPILPGVVAVTFDLPIILQTEGEQSLYANVQGKGLVAITGCGHQTLPRIVDFATQHLAGHKLHGLYGGLHLAPFGPLQAKQEAMIREMGRYGFDRIACNHCTGLPAVELMVGLGYPIVRGTGTQGSVSDLYIGNGDSVTFG
jgi:7,8-dihydropterin-6-yl-methyl-4-(beta-D-ribofuranosyl)aminobenzene 5'-phosphate synthase